MTALVAVKKAVYDIFREVRKCDGQTRVVKDIETVAEWLQVYNDIFLLWEYISSPATTTPRPATSMQRRI